ncbi:MAG: DnaJ domain-containing protein [Treponema sp.]|nr:DnaJ domain-containing protein [Treponema sp.]
MTLFDEARKSHYETLGVAKTAEDGEIKRAYFSLVRKFQPDRFPDKFREIRGAYETLRDRKKRAEYDAMGELPGEAAPLFNEAQRLDRLGRCDKAAELYREILKIHPELDKVRERYAESLTLDDKTGKAGEVWKELCRRHPDNPFYARRLGNCYFERGWHKKGLAEVRRALTLDRSSISAWLLLIDLSFARLEESREITWDEIKALVREAIEAVKAVKEDEWKKITLYTQAFITVGNGDGSGAEAYLEEILRLIPSGGRERLEEGRRSLEAILKAVPNDALGDFYPGLKKMADLLPGADSGPVHWHLENVRMSFELSKLEEKGYPGTLQDLLRLINADLEGEEDEYELALMEFYILSHKSEYDPQLRRLKEEFPEFYDLHGSFFNEVLRVRDPKKILYQRSKKLSKLKRQFDGGEDPRSDPDEPVRRAGPKVGRNDPCPCGSGKKYKRCCGA